MIELSDTQVSRALARGAGLLEYEYGAAVLPLDELEGVVIVFSNHSPAYWTLGEDLKVFEGGTKARLGNRLDLPVLPVAGRAVSVRKVADPEESREYG